MKCADVQARLVDYMGRELGTAQSDLIRSHLASCDDCRAEARDIAASLDLLKKSAADTAGVPDRLSETRRARITRSYRHPWIHWMETHHVMVSICVAAVLLVVALTAVTLLRNEVRPVEGGVDVWIDGGPPPAAAASNAVREQVEPSP